MSIRFWLIVMIGVCVVMTNGLPPFPGTLTEDECKAYFASNDVNEIVHAYFNCPRKLRPKYKRIKSHIAKPSVKFADQ